MGKKARARGQGGGRENKGNARRADPLDDSMSEAATSFYDDASMLSESIRSDGEEDMERTINDDDSKFRGSIDLISNKNAKTALAAVTFIMKKMQERPLGSTLEAIKVTLSDELYHALKKTKIGSIRANILKCLGALFLSLDTDSCETIYGDVQRELIVAVENFYHSAATALAIVTSRCYEPELAIGSTNTFRKIFSKAYLKGDGMPPILKPKELPIIVECLEAWAFTLTVLSKVRGFSRFIDSEISIVAPNIIGIFDQSSVELRIAAGEALAIMYELCKYGKNNLPKIKGLREGLDNLAAGVTIDGGSVKKSTKNDRKSQRSSFNQIRDFIVSQEDPPQKEIQINRQEILTLYNFSDFIIYEFLCWSLESGINGQLTYNEFLRQDWFDLGDVLPQLTSLDKINDSGSKLKKQYDRKCKEKGAKESIKRNRRNATDDHYYE